MPSTGVQLAHSACRLFHRRPMKHALLALVLVATAGCGGGRCEDRAGAYRQVLTPRTGNCGGPYESVGVQGGPSAQAAGENCSGTAQPSADNCRVTMDVSCSMDGVTVTMSGVVDWVHDGSSGRGTVSMTGRDAVSACQGSYDATYTRL